MRGFSCFVTGTDTGVGKTLVTCSLIHLLAQNSITVAGMKPVAAGVTLQDKQWHNEDIDAIISISNVELSPHLVSPYLLKAPTSPDIAARLENTVIEWSRINDSYQQLQKISDSVIVEGIGGFKVPLSQNYDSSEMAVQFGLPVIMVVGIRLGCINHALMTVEIILSRGLKLAGWVVNYIDPMALFDEEIIATLDSSIPALRLGTIPYIKNASIAEAAKYLDISKLKG